MFFLVVGCFLWKIEYLSFVYLLFFGRNLFCFIGFIYIKWFLFNIFVILKVLGLWIFLYLMFDVSIVFNFFSMFLIYVLFIDRGILWIVIFIIFLLGFLVFVENGLLLKIVIVLFWSLKFLEISRLWFFCDFI